MGSFRTMYGGNPANNAAVTNGTKGFSVVLNVLVVDDHASVRRLLQTVAHDDPRFGLVWEAGTLAEALAVAGEECPHVIVLDADLRGEDGLGGVAALRERAPTTAVVVFSSTPYATHESSRAAGAERFVEKGTDLDLLLDVVVEAAEERRRVLRTMTEPALGC